MAHSLLLGMSESGKTTLGKRLSHSLRALNKTVIVLDPLCDPEWSADYQTSNGAEFLEVFWNNESAYAFIDEAGDEVGRYDDEMRQTATRGRHLGHSCFYLAQRGAMVN